MAESAADQVGREQSVYLLGIRVQLDAERVNALPGAPGSLSADGLDADPPITGADLMLGSIVEELQHLAEALLRSHGFGDATISVPLGAGGGVKFVRTYTPEPADGLF